MSRFVVFSHCHQLFLALLLLLLLLPAMSGAEVRFRMIDNFETHNWHAPEWGDQHSLEYSSDWKTEGATSLKLTVTSGSFKWALYSTGCFDAEAPDQIVMDVKNGSSFYQYLKLEILADDGNTYAMDSPPINAGATVTLTYDNPGYRIRMLRLIQEGYTAKPAILYLDYYVNTLNLNSAKKSLSLYLKGGAVNPGRVKLEFHDRNWAGSQGQNGCAYAYLSGISSSSWKQWLAPIDPAFLTIIGSFDPSSIVEVVLSLDHRSASNPIGALLVDDITFVDSSAPLTTYPGLVLPEQTPVDIRQIGVPYLLDDFDGRVLLPGRIDLNLNEFFGPAAVGFSGAGVSAGLEVSHTPDGGEAHSLPNAHKITYSFPLDQTSAYVYYYSLMGVPDGPTPTKDLSFTEKLSLWLKGAAGGNPGTVKVEFHDVNWGANNGYTTGCASAVLRNISDSEWRQYFVSTNNADLKVIGEFDLTRLKEVVISFDYAMVKDKTGALYVDDLQFIDLDQSFTTAPDFAGDAFLDLVERRNFQYFPDAVDPVTGLVFDRVHYRDLATIAGTGFGLTAMVIGAERGWITRPAAEAYVLKVLTNLATTPQGNPKSGMSGYKGFFYHFLEASTGLRKGASELSIIDTAILMAGVITAREYFVTNASIVALADNLYRRVEWDWFLDRTPGPNYNRFYMGWSPENGFTPGHWDYATDENILIDLLAIASPTHPVSSDVFYAWNRYVRSYNGRELIVSYNGSMFQYFFANCWYDLYGMRDAVGVNWWKNSVQAGLANRDFAIAGVDGQGHTNVATYNDKSWGMTAAEGVPAGLHDIYLGGNGARPNGNVDVSGGANWETEGTVAPYGGISMIGFSGRHGGIPVGHVTELMRNFYQNTQLWTGWYGFRDSYTDIDRLKTIKVYDSNLGQLTDKSAISLYPRYKAAYFSIDQGAILLMLENYRSGLVWNTFMRNDSVQQAVAAVFPRLAVTISGDGGGAVHSDPTGITCSSTGTGCGYNFAIGSRVIMKATPSTSSLFTGWSGECNGVCSCNGASATCDISQGSEIRLNATFSYVKPAMIDGTGAYHDTLQAAYNSALAGQTILVREFSFTENLILNEAKAVAVKGGYAANYLDRPGYSLLQGALTVGKGLLVIDRLTVK